MNKIQTSAAVQSVASQVVRSDDAVLTTTLASAGVKYDFALFRMGAIKEIERIDLDAQRKNAGDIWTEKIVRDTRMALIACARDGYVPGQHCHLTYYGGQRPELKVTPNYRGVKELLGIKGVRIFPPQIVHGNDVFRIQREIREGRMVTDFRHEVDMFSDRGAAGGVYVAYEVDGRADVLVLDRTYLAKVQKFAVSRKSDAWSGPHVEEMWKKTAILRLPKHLQLGMPDPMDPGDPDNLDVEPVRMLGPGTGQGSGDATVAPPQIEAGTVTVDAPPPPPVTVDVQSQPQPQPARKRRPKAKAASASTPEPAPTPTPEPDPPAESDGNGNAAQDDLPF